MDVALSMDVACATLMLYRAWLLEKYQMKAIEGGTPKSIVHHFLSP
jgi:hypothetical protein